MGGVSAILLGILSAILYVLLYGLLALGILLALVLLLPVRARVRAQPDLTLSDEWEPSGPLPWQADIRWGWVLVRLALTGGGARVAARAVIVIKGDEVSVMPLSKGGAIEKILEAVPGLIEKAQSTNR